MHTLVLKLGATGDVVRTSSLLRRIPGDVTWITSGKNSVYLQGLNRPVRCLAWEEREQARDTLYDLAINLEDTDDVGGFLNTVKHRQKFGAYLDGTQLRYTDDSKAWFDLSLISVYGRERADQLKFQNRRTYQELVFEGLGYTFSGEKYCLPRGTQTDLQGDIAIAAESGPVWPMKKWAYYDQLRVALQEKGWKVNVLPTRKTLLEHLGDVQSHRCLVGGDTLPMHLALGSDVPCVSVFNCTSPWEIHDYGIQTKLISPLLPEFFYKRTFDERATTAISLEIVLHAVEQRIEALVDCKAQ